MSVVIDATKDVPFDKTTFDNEFETATFDPEIDQEKDDSVGPAKMVCCIGYTICFLSSTSGN